MVVINFIDNAMVLDIVAASLNETLADHVTLFDLASGRPLLWDQHSKILRS